LKVGEPEFYLVFAKDVVLIASGVTNNTEQGSLRLGKTQLKKLKKCLKIASQNSLICSEFSQNPDITPCASYISTRILATSNWEGHSCVGKLTKLCLQQISYFTYSDEAISLIR
jgi:hypothetical protein